MVDYLLMQTRELLHPGACTSAGSLLTSCPNPHNHDSPYCLFLTSLSLQARSCASWLGSRSRLTTCWQLPERRAGASSACTWPSPTAWGRCAMAEEGAAGWGQPLPCNSGDWVWAVHAVCTAGLRPSRPPPLHHSMPVHPGTPPAGAVRSEGAAGWAATGSSGAAGPRCAAVHQ